MKKLLSLLIATTVLLTLMMGGTAIAAGDETWHLVCSVQSLDSEYWAQMAAGAQMFADSRPDVTYTLQVNGGDDNVQMQGLKDFIAEHGQRAIVMFDPSSAANTVNIVETCEDAGVYVTLVNHCAEGLYPEDYEYFAAHFTPDDFTAGYNTAKYLFDAIGGEGKVTYLHGQIGQDASAFRFEGFNKALEEYPGIELLDYQVADWDQEKAMAITETWLATLGEIDGIVTANDTMGLGAIEALKKVGKNGQIPVTGTDGIQAAFEAVQDGDMLCTIANDGYLLLGYGAAYAYAAATGQPYESTRFYSKTVFVTQDNVDQVIADYIEGTPTFDFTDLEYPILSVRGKD